MDSTLPVAVPSPYKSRRAWLIAFGVIDILMACVFLLLILFSVIAFVGPAAARMPSSQISPRALMVLVGLEYGLLAGVFFTGGIGSIRCKNWARIFMLVVSGLWLGLGLVATLIMVFIVPAIMRQQPGNLSPSMRHASMVGIVTVMTGLMVLLPAIFLFFYSRKSVRATCLAKGAQVAALAPGGTPAPGLPVPLAILGVWQALGVLSVFTTLFVRGAFVFGVVLHGAAAFLVLLTLSILSGYAAWAIFRRKLIGWQIALFIAGFGTINMLVSYVRRPDLLQLFREIGYNDQTLRIYEQSPQLLAVFWLGSIVFMTVYLVFLLYTRKFFPTEERAQPPVPAM
jgi:hypothetical protein